MRRRKNRSGCGPEFDFGTYYRIRDDAVEQDRFGDISDKLLERAVEALSIPDCQQPTDADLDAKDTKEKIRINLFSSRVVDSMQEEIVRFTQVQKYVQNRDKADPDFHNKLRGYFWAEYRRLVESEGLIGDDLFDALLKVVRDRIPETKYNERRAVLPIITYLFVICDLFFRTEDERRRAEANSRGRS